MSPTQDVAMGGNVRAKGYSGFDTKTSDIPEGKEKNCDRGMSLEFDFLRWGTRSHPLIFIGCLRCQKQ